MSSYSTAVKGIHLMQYLFKLHFLQYFSLKLMHNHCKKNKNKIIDETESLVHLKKIKQNIKITVHNVYTIIINKNSACIFMSG